MTNIDFNAIPQTDQVTLVTDWLSRANYRVIRPMEVRSTYCEDKPPEKLITVAILDTETTGTNHAKDKIIELGFILVEICPETGQAFRVLKVFNELEDPGFPIPEESTRIHHITDDMVAGKRFNDAEIDALMASVVLVVAHNASFDRVFAEQRFPIFATKAWACSFKEISWSEEGVGSAKLEFLAYHFGFHYTGHRASTDCHALLEVLQQTLPGSGKKAMQALLQHARIPEIKISALASPIETKDTLKERSYRWNPEKRVWAKCVQDRDLEQEVTWLKDAVYGGKGFRLEYEKLTAKNRFSNRPGPTEIVKHD